MSALPKDENLVLHCIISFIYVEVPWPSTLLLCCPDHQNALGFWAPSGLWIFLVKGRLSYNQKDKSDFCNVL